MNALNDLLFAAFGDLISLMLSIPMTILVESLVALVTTLIGGAA